MSKVEKPRIACKSCCKVGRGQWEGKSSWQKPKDRQTHLDFVLGPRGTKEEFKAGRDMARQCQCFIYRLLG